LSVENENVAFQLQPIRNVARHTVLCRWSTNCTRILLWTFDLPVLTGEKKNNNIPRKYPL